MIEFAIRLELYRQCLRRRMLNVSRVPSNAYHIVIIFVALILAYPVVFLDIGTAPSGLPALGAETDIFFAIILTGVTLIMTVVLAPLGFLII